jgi:hypothetical protein
MKRSTKGRRTAVALLAFGAAAASTLVFAGAAGATSLSNVVVTGSPAPGPCASLGSTTLPTTSWFGTLGCWTDGFGPEPLGFDFLTASATGTGWITFRWRFRTTDTISFDWVEVRLDGVCQPPSGGPSCRYNPNPVLGNLFDSGWQQTTIQVPTGGAHTLFIGVRQDAFGDEASLDFMGLRGNLQLKP